MFRAKRGGGVAITIAIIICMIAIVGAFVVTQVRDNFGTQLARSLASQHLEHLVVEALTEGHYLLAMGSHPASSASAARRELEAAVKSSGAGRGAEADAAPASKTGPILDHDVTAFLRDSSATVYLAPTTVAAGCDPSGRTALSAVAVVVKERKLGKLVKLPAGQDLDPTNHELAELGLPPGVVAYRSTWGVVELSCEATEQVRRMKISRRAVQRKLFAVIDYELYGEPIRSYAYIFPAPLGQVLTAGTGISLL